jgi:hypothetical protein
VIKSLFWRNCILTCYRRSSRHIDNLRPTPILLRTATTTAVLYSRHHRTHYDIRTSNPNANTIEYKYLLNRLFLMPSQSRRGVLSRRPNMRYRSIMSRRYTQQHSGTISACTAHEWICNSICLLVQRCMPDRFLRVQCILSVWLL